MSGTANGRLGIGASRASSGRRQRPVCTFMRGGEGDGRRREGEERKHNTHLQPLPPLRRFPPLIVKRGRLHERDVRSEGSVDSGTVQADEHADVDRRPRWPPHVAVRAELVPRAAADLLDC